MNSLKASFALSLLAGALALAVIPSAHAFKQAEGYTSGAVHVAQLSASPRTGVSLKQATKFGAGSPGATTIHRPRFEDTSVN